MSTDIQDLLKEFIDNKARLIELTYNPGEEKMGELRAHLEASAELGQALGRTLHDMDQQELQDDISELVAGIIAHTWVLGSAAEVSKSIAQKVRLEATEDEAKARLLEHQNNFEEWLREDW